MNKIANRLDSIDVFRALTMFLMIFVNDVAGVRHIPQWIEHVEVDESGLGFADVIFPAFLFIVGLSLPLALQRKLNQGHSTSYLLRYISVRAIALIIMGIFQVNFSYYNDSLSVLPKPIFIILATVSFFLTWLDYRSTDQNKKRHRIQQGIGWLLILLLAISFRSGTTTDPGWMEIHWWGILGLIGWSYWLIALFYLFSRGRSRSLLVFLGLLCAINIAIHTGAITWPAFIVGDTSHPILVAAGTVIMLWYQFELKNNPQSAIKFWQKALLVGVSLMMVGGVLSGLTDGINKIRATPAWVYLTLGISTISFGLFTYFMDYKKQSRKFSWISAAGTNTLTCYLLPYILYASYSLIGFSWPDYLQQGIGGILRSLLIAFIIVQIAELLERKGIRIKV